MVNDEFKFQLNNRIEIEMEDGLYKSLVQEVTDDHIAINIPVKEGSFLTLKKGEQVRALYSYEKDVYAFDTTILGRKVDKIFMILLGIPESVRKVQRRNFVRVHALLDISYIKIRISNKVEELKNKDTNFIPAIATDISGGGMKIRIKENIKSGDILMINIPVKDESLTVKGQVIRADRDKTGVTTCGMNFIGLDNTSREKIIKLVFEIMREYRVRGAEEE